MILFTGGGVADTLQADTPGMAGGHARQGHAWGGMAGGHACVAGETATAADDTHPTGMNSCFWENSMCFPVWKN